MKHPEASILLLLLAVAFLGCSTPKRHKSGRYYLQHQATLEQVRHDFDTLYQHQPLSIGFTDKSFKYYFVEFTTDTLRMVYNNASGAAHLRQTLQQFGYDTVRFYRLVDQMKQAQCIWLDKVYRYFQHQQAGFTYLSFGAVAAEKPFVENKYYVLIFPDKKVPLTALTNRVRRGDLMAINDSVYYSISNRFR